MKGKVFRITEYGLCEVELDPPSKQRAAFTLDKLIGYAGQPFRDFGLRIGAEVDVDKDETGRISSARLIGAAAAA